ncbi:MAG TPA: hypothetical protein VJQ82_10120 [Terriglobales bacterium]|nr:hypothetical protein [Terriglobales bacterium]
MQAVLYENPREPQDWLRWSYHHRDSHSRIRIAIQNQGGPELPDYPVDPISQGHLGDFLQYNSQLHSDMNGVLKLQSSDLLDIDFENEQQRIAWIHLHAQEHFDAEAMLGI